MAKIEAEIQGIDRDFKFTGSFDGIEMGEVTSSKAQELMRKLPDEGGVSPEYLEGKEELCPPHLILSFTRMVKKGLIRKRVEEEFVSLSLVGGEERGKIGVIEVNELVVVSFSEADEIIRDFFRKASEEPTLHPTL